MNRRSFIVLSSAFALQPTLPAQSATDADLHALYAAILTDSLLYSCLGSEGYCDTPNGPCYCDDPKKQHILIRNVTVPLSQADRTRLGNLKLHRETYPPGPTPPWQRRELTYDARVPTELLEAFDATPQQPIEVPGPFDLPAVSLMATAEDVKGFYETHSTVGFGITLPSTPEQDERIKRHEEHERKYGGFTACIQLSTALFSRDRSIALATLRWDTGSDVEALEMVYILEKFPGQWRRYATPMCICEQA